MFLIPEHPPVPPGTYPCPACLFHPGSATVIMQEQFDDSGQAFATEQIDCPTCNGRTYVDERRQFRERRAAPDRRHFSP
jgi:hypothetical protein